MVSGAFKEQNKTLFFITIPGRSLLGSIKKGGQGGGGQGAGEMEMVLARTSEPSRGQLKLFRAIKSMAVFGNYGGRNPELHVLAQHAGDVYDPIFTAGDVPPPISFHAASRILVIGTLLEFIAHRSKRKPVNGRWLRVLLNFVYLGRSLGAAACPSLRGINEAAAATCHYHHGILRQRAQLEIDGKTIQAEMKAAVLQLHDTTLWDWRWPSPC
jgi:hypothetical protein